MSKKVTFKNMLAIGEVDRIKLSTMDGKTGYKITKFQTINNRPGAQDSTSVTTITNKENGVAAGVDRIDLSNNTVLAVAYTKHGDGSTETDNTLIILDNKVINQDIFVTAGNPDGGTDPVNYYIELETMPLTDLEATYLTLQNIRTITS